MWYLQKNRYRKNVTYAAILGKSVAAYAFSSRWWILPSQFLKFEVVNNPFTTLKFEVI